MSDAPVSAVLLRSPGNVFRQPGLKKVNMLAAGSNSLHAAVFACGHASIVTGCLGCELNHVLPDYHHDEQSTQR